jgi:hypothetical protein
MILDGKSLATQIAIYTHALSVSIYRPSDSRLHCQKDLVSLPSNVLNSN